jgi:hypothetical protein
LQSHIPAIRAQLRARGRALVDRTGQALTAATQGYAPVDTGRLRASYGWTLTGDTAGEMATDVDYAEYQERGTVFQAGTPHVGPGAVSAYPVLEAGLPGLFDG